jgi:hypothetical protein
MPSPTRTVSRPRVPLATIALIVVLALGEQGVAAAQGEATVRLDNPDGYAFTIGPVSAGRAACSFGLPSASQDTLHPEKLPSMSVGDADVQTVVAWPEPEQPAEDGGDFMEVARRAAGVAPLVSTSATEVRFLCWLGLPGQSAPTRGVLRQLMDGEELLVNFVRADDSAGVAVFALDGARERLASTFGISESPGAGDYLQDDLLRFRVNYRSSTCYLLAGKKNLNRCLDRVNACAQRSHASLIDMTGCVEID